MNDYWKNELRYYPVSIKIQHFENTCALHKASDTIQFGFGHLVKELTEASYEKNLTKASVNAIDHFGYEIQYWPFDYPKEDPLLFDYQEIQSAFKEFIQFKLAEDEDIVEELVISRIVRLLDRHYYCPYGTQASLAQHLNLAGYSKTKQKALLKEKMVSINGSNTLVDLKTIINEHDEVMIEGQVIPRLCKNKIAVEKWESW